MNKTSSSDGKFLIMPCPYSAVSDRIKIPPPAAMTYL